MNGNTEPDEDRDGSPPDRSAIVRRLEIRCEQLGFSYEEAALRAGMSARYLRQLLHAEADFDPGALVRLAAVLQTSREELVSGRTDPAPGQRGPARRPVLMRLTTRECWDRLGTHGVGRVALPTPAAPTVLPVNYLVDGATVVYRTDPYGAAAAEAGSDLSFETDHIDEAVSTGWSVLITGTAEHVGDPEAVRRLAEQPGAQPWAGGSRDLWIRVVPGAITGRRISSQ